MEFLFSILSILVWAVIILFWIRFFYRKTGTRKTIAADGHVIPKQNDITCEGKEGHVHEPLSSSQQKDYGPRYIVHDDPAEGYVVLNGVMRKISECRDL
ncbi:MAG: hypothetical protein IKG37_04890 [Solobacterium sp.]|nr:hypothetical protein [Solobacterium sp.]